MLKKRLLMLGVAVGLGAVAMAQGGAKMMMNGKVASTKVGVIQGEAYVPLSDMSRALGMVVVKKADGYELTGAGVANQVEGGRGKMCEVVFDWRW